MVDFHSHILPNIDDGSQSLAESLELLERSAAQGVTAIAATPHFYAGQDNPEQFLSRRQEAAQRLKEVWRPHFPELRLGAEVYYYPGIRLTDDLYKMRLEGTNLLMVEMPFSDWSGRMVDEILDLNEDVQVVLAHAERYLRYAKKPVWAELLDNGILMQTNASFFLHWTEKRKAMKFLKNGYIQFLGSDCHNLTTRPPKLGEALEAISRSLGAEQVQLLKEAGEQALREESVYL